MKGGNGGLMKQNEERAKIKKIDYRYYDLTNEFSRRRAIYDVFDKINEIISYLNKEE